MKIPIDTNGMTWSIVSSNFLYLVTTWDALLLCIIKYKSGNRPYWLSVFFVSWHLQFQEVLRSLSFWVFAWHPECSQPWQGKEKRLIDFHFWVPMSSSMLCVPSLAPVVLLCVAEGVAACSGGRLHETLPEVSVGDLPAGPPAWVGWANGVWASQAAGHGRLEGQRLHGTRGIRAVVVFLWSQERLWRVASRRGRVYVKLTPPSSRSSFLGLPWGLAPSCGLWAALFIIILSDRGLCATHKRGIGNVRARSGWGLWERSSAAGCAGLWGGRYWAVRAVTLK